MEFSKISILKAIIRQWCIPYRKSHPTKQPGLSKKPSKTIFWTKEHLRIKWTKTGIDIQLSNGTGFKDCTFGRGGYSRQILSRLSKAAKRLPLIPGWCFFIGVWTRHKEVPWRSVDQDWYVDKNCIRMIHCHDSWISRFARNVAVLPHPHHLPFSILCSPSILCLCFKMFQVFVSQMPQIIPEKTSSTSMSYASNTSSISGEAINRAEWTFGLPWHWSHLQRSRCGVGWWWRGLLGGILQDRFGMMWLLSQK